MYKLVFIDECEKEQCSDLKITDADIDEIKNIKFTFYHIDVISFISMYKLLDLILTLS